MEETLRQKKYYLNKDKKDEIKNRQGQKNTGRTEIGTPHKKRKKRKKKTIIFEKQLVLEELFNICIMSL